MNRARTTGRRPTGPTVRIGPVIAVLVLVLAGSAAATPGPVHVTVFHSDDCVHCEAIEPPAMEALEEALGCEIRVRYRDVADPDNYGLLVRAEGRAGDEGNELPVVFVGEDVLGGPDEIELRLRRVVARYARTGGAGSFVSGPEGGPATQRDASGADRRRVGLAYFHQPGCSACDRVHHLLRSVRARFPGAEVRRYDTSLRENAIRQEAMCAALDVPPKVRLRTPLLIIGDRVLIGGDLRDRAVSAAVRAAAESGAPCPWERLYDLEAAEARLGGTFRALGLGAVVAGGMLDGVNPCAFAALALFVACMRAAGHDRRRMLAVGGAFILSVFAVYFAIGLGLREVVVLLDALPWAATAVTVAIAGLCLVLAVYSALDARLAALGRSADMHLQLPAFLKRRVRGSFVRFGRAPGLLLAGLLLGAVVSLLELACTGQIYLPLIKVMTASAGPNRLRAIGLLAVYNVCFVVPLAAVLGAACWGVSSERLTDFFRRRLVATKAVTAVFFLLLAAVVLATEYHW